jgi:hypothetical protein
VVSNGADGATSMTLGCLYQPSLSLLNRKFPMLLSSQSLIGVTHSLPLREMYPVTGSAATRVLHSHAATFSSQVTSILQFRRGRHYFDFGNHYNTWGSTGVLPSTPNEFHGPICDRENP